MKKLLFFTAIIICIWANSSLNTDYAWAKKINNQTKLVKLDNLNDSSLEVFINDSDLIQNISTKNTQLNLSFDASNLINNTLLPTSFKIEIYDVTANKRLLGIFRPSILNQKQITNFKTNIELVNLTRSSALEINIYDTKNKFFAGYNANIVIKNQSEISFTELEAADCTGEFGKCQLEYIFQNIHFTTLPGEGLKTKIEQNTDGSYSVNLPLIRGKKKMRVNNIFGDSGSSGNQDFSFDFDGANLFVIKDGVTTLIGSQGPAGEKGDIGATGPKGDDGAPGSFSGGNTDINGTLTFIANGKLQDAVLNGFSLAMTNNAAQVPFTVQGAAAQTANLQEWQNSTGTVLTSINPSGGLENTSSTAGWSTAATFINNSATAFSGQRIEFYHHHLGVKTPSGFIGARGWSSGGQHGELVLGVAGNGVLYQGASLDANGLFRASTLRANVEISANNIGMNYALNGPSITHGLWAADHLDMGFKWGGLTRMVGSWQGRLGLGFTNRTGINSLFHVKATDTTIPTVIVQSIAAQTANLQEWQNSAGTALTSITSSGNLVFSGTATINSQSGGTTTVGAPNGGAYLGNTSTFGANMLVNSNGVKIANNILLGWSSDSTSYGTYDIALGRNSTGVLEINNGTSGQWAALRVGSQAAATQPLIVRGATSQTANLQEWQNRNGTVLSSISSGGAISAPSAYISNDSNAFQVILSNLVRLRSGTYVDGDLSIYKVDATTLGCLIAGSSRLTAQAASAIPSIVKGATSQTANLQEWQNRNGTILSKVDASGNITIGETGSASGVKLIGGYSAGNYLDLNATSPSLASGATAWPLRFITTLSGFRFSNGNSVDLIPIGSNTLAFYVPTTSTSSQNSTAPTGTLATLQAGSINISDTIKLTARSSPPSSPNLGDLYVDSDSNELCFYDGGSWTGIKAGGACS